MALTAAELRRRRFAAQDLHALPHRATPDVVHDVLAVQAQDLRSARLAVRARTNGLVARDVDNSLDEGAIVVSWLMRGTLHLVHRDDYAWLWALTAPTSASSNRRRLAQEGVSPADAEKALATIENALASEGPLPRTELSGRIARVGVRTAGQATPHLLMLAALRGLTALGAVQQGKQSFVLTREWLGHDPADTPFSRERALGELVRRYLRGHGPASVVDIATWSGLGLRDIRAGLREVSGEVREDGDLVDLAARATASDNLPPRLLPAFDPYLLGWRDRTFAVPAKHHRRVYPGGGMLRATAVVGGSAVANWTITRRGGKAAVEIDAFGRLDGATDAALRAESDDVARFEAGGRPR